MTLDPYKKRELVFLLLFSADMGQDLLSEEVVDLVKNECKVAKKHVLEALERARTIFGVFEACDELISRICTEYKITRIQSVERNILRLAIFEIAMERKIPTKVVFAEARRLAKKFSTDESVNFVYALVAAVALHAGIIVEDKPPNLDDAYRAMSAAHEVKPGEMPEPLKEIKGI